MTKTITLKDLIDLGIIKSNTKIKYKKSKSRKRKQKKLQNKRDRGHEIGGLKSDSSHMVGYGSNISTEIQHLQRKALEDQMKNPKVSEDQTISRFQKEPPQNNLLTIEQFKNFTSPILNRIMYGEGMINQLLSDQGYSKEDLIKNEKTAYFPSQKNDYEYVNTHDSKIVTKANDSDSFKTEGNLNAYAEEDENARDYDNIFVDTPKKDNKNIFVEQQQDVYGNIDEEAQTPDEFTKHYGEYLNNKEPLTPEEVQKEYDDYVKQEQEKEHQKLIEEQTKQKIIEEEVSEKSKNLDEEYEKLKKEQLGVIEPEKEIIQDEIEPEKEIIPEKIGEYLVKAEQYIILTNKEVEIEPSSGYQNNKELSYPKFKKLLKNIGKSDAEINNLLETYNITDQRKIYQKYHAKALKHNIDIVEKRKNKPKK